MKTTNLTTQKDSPELKIDTQPYSQGPFGHSSRRWSNTRVQPKVLQLNTGAYAEPQNHLEIGFDTAPGNARSRYARVRLSDKMLGATFATLCGGPENAVRAFFDKMDEKTRAALILDLMDRHTELKAQETEE